ncbi:MAG: hypothetical protein D6730_19860 [Bacteroidetes bacterium]|nr:MAG: hypothetical protein D6730_19860 [Bacteroidota bacterium]
MKNMLWNTRLWLWCFYLLPVLGIVLLSSCTQGAGKIDKNTSVIFMEDLINLARLYELDAEAAKLSRENKLLDSMLNMASRSGHEDPARQGGTGTVEPFSLCVHCMRDGNGNIFRPGDPSGGTTGIGPGGTNYLCCPEVVVLLTPQGAEVEEEPADEEMNRSANDLAGESLTPARKPVTISVFGRKFDCYFLHEFDGKKRITIRSGTERLGSVSFLLEKTEDNQLLIGEINIL